ncbi:MAG: pyrroline-5-carboxylate reductase [Chloroflexi bacterium]|nr:pyrroline-5-carboxylate reductase [Chloroflexota bacterium]
MRIAFIGSGVMGEAIVKGLLTKGLAKPGDIIVSDVSQERVAALETTFSVRGTTQNTEAVRDAEVVILAVKPQVLGEVMKGLQGQIPARAVVFSIVAGATITTLRTGLAHGPIVRTMPNTPAQIGAGITVWTVTPEVTPVHKENVGKILVALGKDVFVPDEKFLDMATAVNGSGPAYFFLVFESLIDAAVHIGFSRDVGTQLVLQTALGSARFMEATGKHPAELRNMVTSPGGTTAEALLKLEEGRLRAVMTEAVIAAYEKARKLGEPTVK